MTILRLFSDPHLGVNRTAHTTQASRTRLKQAVFDQALAVAGKTGYGPTDAKVCLGDLFDTYNNDGNTLLQGYKIASRCSTVLAGNHDVANRADSKSSLECLFAVMDRGDVDADQPTYKATPYLASIDVVWVDHKLTQLLFEQTLENLLHRPKDKEAVLLLHCNYDSPFATDTATLNLTRDMAERLLSRFDYILLGHEHKSRTDFDGRLILTGNTHPTSFADVSDKFFWDIVVNDGHIEVVKPTCIWYADRGYLSIDWVDLPELTDIDPAVQFIDVTGEARAQHMPTIAKQVADLWGLSDNLLMVRNNVTCVTEAIEERPVNTYQDIPSRITHELRESHLSELWHKYLDKIGEIA